MGENRGVMICFSLIFVYIASIVLGTISAILWANGYITAVKATLPYAILIAALLLLILGISVGYAIMRRKPSIIPVPNFLRQCFNKFGISALIGITLVIVVGLIILVTNPSFTIKFILSLCGSIGFWLMILSFFAFIICEIRRISFLRNSQPPV